MNYVQIRADSDEIDRGRMKNTVKTVCCLCHQKKDFIPVQYEPKNDMKIGGQKYGLVFLKSSRKQNSGI
jgi:hypothetical protein